VRTAARSSTSLTVERHNKEQKQKDIQVEMKTDDARGF
jgi:hypothetical protein